jgi:hypothetical protein
LDHRTQRRLESGQCVSVGRLGFAWFLSFGRYSRSSRDHAPR